MVTILHSGQKNTYDESLLQEGDALYVQGIGHLAQHHCWLDMLWSSGIVYAFRDIKRKELRSCIKDKTTYSCSEVDSLREDILGYERRIASHTKL